MTRILNPDDRRGSHARPADVRQSLEASLVSDTGESQGSRNHSRSPLHRLAIHAKHRRATQESQDLQHLPGEAESNSLKDVGNNSNTSSLSQEKNDYESANLDNRAQSISRTPSLAQVETSLSSAEFGRRASTPLENSLGSTPEPSPASFTSLEGLREEVAANELISARIEALAADIDDAVTVAMLNEKITNAMIEYYGGKGRSMLEELTQVTTAAQEYDFSHIAARAQLWKAMILYGIDETANMAEILNDILNIIVHDEECTDADRYHMRRLVLLYGPEMWLRFESTRRNNSQSEYTPLDPESPNTERDMHTWGRGVVQALENKMGDKTGLWPTLEESLTSMEEGSTPEGFVPGNQLPSFPERQERLQQKIEQLEADVARFRAERQVYSELNTPDYLLAGNQQPLTQGPRPSWERTYSGSQRPLSVLSEESWLGARPVSRDASKHQALVKQMSDGGSEIGYGITPQYSASSPQRALSQQSSTSSSRDHRLLRVRNKTPRLSGGSSPRSSSSRSSGRRSRSRTSISWRTGASLDQQRNKGIFAAENVVPERRGSNLRNMALAESSDEDQEEDMSPKTASHRLPSSMRQRSLIENDGKALGKLLTELEGHAPDIFGMATNSQNDQFAGGYNHFRDVYDDGLTRQRFNSLSPEAVLQIDAEEHDMTGALSPTEIEQRFPKFAYYKEQERQKSGSEKKSPSSSDYPPYEEIRAKALNPSTRRRGQDPPAISLAGHVLTSISSEPPTIENQRSESSGAGKAPERTSNFGLVNPDLQFDFDHVQRTPQASERRSFQAPINGDLLSRRNKNVAPLTPECKSPPSSAMSLPRYFNEKAIMESPGMIGFDDSVPRDDQIPSPTRTTTHTAPAQRPVDSVQILRPTVYKPDLPFRRVKLQSIGDRLPDRRDESSSTGRSQDESRNPRISTMLNELQNMRDFRPYRQDSAQPYFIPLRRDSKPDIPSPLRESFAPSGLDYGAVKPVKPARPSVDTIAGERERSDSIYDDIESEYPSPLVGSDDAGYETDIDGRKGKRRGLRIKT